MSEHRNAVRAGFFMILSVAMTIAIILAIAGMSRFTEHWEERTVQFSLSDDVGGLNVGDDVRIGGFKVGDVKSIDLVGYEQSGPTTQPARIVVTFSLPQKFMLREDADIRIQGTLTGQSWLNIYDLGKGSPATETTALLGKPNITISSLAPEFRGLIADVRTGTVPRLNNAIDDIHVLLSEERPKISNAVDRGAEALTTVRDLVGPSTTDFHGAVADLHQITTGVKEKLPSLMDSAQGILKKVDTAVTSATDTLTAVHDTAMNAKDATAGIRSILTANRSKFEEIISSLKSTSDNLKNASAEIRHSPWRLLYKPGPGELANLNLFDSAREFADGANSLSDASAALRDALNDKSSSPEQVKKLMDKLDATFAHFQEVEQKLWKDVQE